MNLPLDIPALIRAATDIDSARNTPLAVSVYLDETAPGTWWATCAAPSRAPAPAPG